MYSKFRASKLWKTLKCEFLRKAACHNGYIVAEKTALTIKKTILVSRRSLINRLDSRHQRCCLAQIHVSRMRSKSFGPSNCKDGRKSWVFGCFWVDRSTNTKNGSRLINLEFYSNSYAYVAETSRRRVRDAAFLSVPASP